MGKDYRNLMNKLDDSSNNNSPSLHFDDLLPFLLGALILLKVIIALA